MKEYSGGDAASRVAILGSSSFAGRALVEDLNLVAGYGFQILAVQRGNEPEDAIRLSQVTTLSNMDIRTGTRNLIQDLLDWQPTIVVDLMGQGMVEQSWSSPRLWFETNLAAKSELLMALKDLPSLKMYIRFSTPEVFGDHDGLLRANTPLSPTTPYAITHAANDQMIAAMHRRFDFPGVTCRFANFYGPGQQIYRLIPRACLAALLGEKFPLQGGGKSRRAFIYRSDIVSAVRSVISCGEPGKTYHFSPEETYAIQDIVRAVAQLGGIRFEQFVERVPGRPSQDAAYSLDTIETRQALGWRDDVNLKDGLAQTWAWVEANRRKLSEAPREFRLVP